jgi:vacuolar-type H+-ATPase subunit H
MSEKNIQQVLEIEKQAAEMQEKAKRDAQEIPVKAEQEAQALIAKAKADAQEEARKMIADAQSGAGAENVAADIASQNTEFEANAKKNFDKAVAFVLDRVIGKG